MPAMTEGTLLFLLGKHLSVAIRLTPKYSTPDIMEERIVTASDRLVTPT
jgi:hypothetical protein